MNKRSYVLIGVLLLMIIGAGAYVYFKGSQTTDKQPVTTTDSKDSEAVEMSEQAGGLQAAAQQRGQYVEYSEDLVASTKGAKLLFFHAPWCPQCRELDASIKSSSLPDNTTIFKLDYDSNQALRQKYGVTIQTTVVKIDDQGDKIASYVAYEDPTFAAVEKELLP